MSNQTIQGFTSRSDAAETSSGKMAPCRWMSWPASWFMMPCALASRRANGDKSNVAKKMMLRQNPGHDAANSANLRDHDQFVHVDLSSLLAPVLDEVNELRQFGNLHSKHRPAFFPAQSWLLRLGGLIARQLSTCLKWGTSSWREMIRKGCQGLVNSKVRKKRNECRPKSRYQLVMSESMSSLPILVAMRCEYTSCRAPSGRFSAKARRSPAIISLIWSMKTIMQRQNDVSGSIPCFLSE